MILENKVWDHVKASDAKFSEKADAWIVTNTMKAKRKLGMGLKALTNCKKAKLVHFNRAVVKPRKKILN